jgi:hypothetical protein
VTQSDPEPTREEAEALRVAMQQPQPPLSPEALDRIDQAERAAQERYDRHKLPHFPTSPAFSFLAEDVFRAMARIVEYVRIYSAEVLDAHLKEYLEAFPAELATDKAIWVQLAARIWGLTDKLWAGYREVLRFEPLRRRTHSGAMGVGILDEHPEWEPGRFPDGESWAGFMRQSRRPDSEMARLDARYHATIQRSILDRVKHYEGQANSRLQMKSGAAPPTESGATESMRVREAEETTVATPASTPAVADEPAGCGSRRAEVDAFLASCNRKADFTVRRRHIWLAVGHRSPRQFEYWQAFDGKATTANDRNFRLFLSMEPSAFLTLLKKRGIV